jgi:phage gp46-like protein
MQFYLNGSAASLTDYAQDDLIRAVLNSLFSWARAEDDDELPGISKFGFWADTYADEEGDKFGSRLWLLSRAKMTDENLAKAEEYAEEALQWMIDDGVATEIHATAERGDENRMNLLVEIVRPDKADLNARFMNVWENLS